MPQVKIRLKKTVLEWPNQLNSFLFLLFVKKMLKVLISWFQDIASDDEEEDEEDESRREEKYNSSDGEN